MGATKIPRRPIQRVEGLKKEEMDCLTWYVLFGDSIEECYARFVVPQFKDNPKLLKEYAKQFMAASNVKDYLSAYKEELEVLFRERERIAEIKKDDESEEDFKARRKRESVEKVMAKIAGLVDEVSDAETLLDAIKAMKDTGYFENAVQNIPPRRYLPESCMLCKYKCFVDEHVKSGDIEEIAEK